MSRRRTLIIEEAPQEVLLLDVRPKDGVVWDYAQNMQYQWNVVSQVVGDTFTNSTVNGGSNPYYYYLANPPSGNPGWTLLYANKKTKWNTSTPNPGVNGLSPDWFGCGLRLKFKMYLSNHQNAKTPLNNHAYNNAQYRGFDLIWLDGGWKWTECKTTYNPDAGIKQSINYVESQNDPMVLQLDFDETYHRCKIFDSTGVLKFDSGLIESLHNNERCAHLSCGNWNGDQTRPNLCYFSYIKLIRGDSVSDFLN